MHRLKNLLLVPALLGLASAAPAGAPFALSPVVTSGLSNTVFVGNAGDGSDRLFIVEKSGRIKIWDGSQILATDFLNTGPSGLGVSTNISSATDERGLFCVAFHPDYASNGRFFVHYTRASDGDSIVSEFAVSADPNVADAASEQIILGPVSQPQSNHNGGMIAFGPDGMLYVALGDGGGANDVHGVIGNGQDTTNLLGAILRIDVDSTPDPGLNYAIPPDNPFFGGTGPDVATREEIFAYGFRNPWRFSFDSGGANRLFAGDVGQGSLEEVDIVVSGGNYGWRRMEGTACFNPSSGCQTGSLILPIAQYANSGFGGDCAMTGGYVYRGTDFPPLVGNYFYGDFCSGKIFMLEETSPGVFSDSLILTAPFTISSFGEDEQGELYVVDNGGGVYQLTGPVPVDLSAFSLD